jgi:hypothetical protein
LRCRPFAVPIHAEHLQSVMLSKTLSFQVRPINGEPGRMIHLNGAEVLRLRRGVAYFTSALMRYGLSLILRMSSVASLH